MSAFKQTPEEVKKSEEIRQTNIKNVVALIGTGAFTMTKEFVKNYIKEKYHKLTDSDIEELCAKPWRENDVRLEMSCYQGIVIFNPIHTVETLKRRRINRATFAKIVDAKGYYRSVRQKEIARQKKIAREKELVEEKLIEEAKKREQDILDSINKIVKTKAKVNAKKSVLSNKIYQKISGSSSTRPASKLASIPEARHLGMTPAEPVSTPNERKSGLANAFSKRSVPVSAVGTSTERWGRAPTSASKYQPRFKTSTGFVPRLPVPAHVAPGPVRANNRWR